MKWLIRQFLSHLLALLGTSYLIPGLVISREWNDLVTATIVLSIINVFVKPIIRIFLFPLNFVTLNLFTIIINMGVVFLFTRFVATVKLTGWTFNGANLNGFIIPSIYFSLIGTYLVTSILITLIVNFINWLFD